MDPTQARPETLAAFLARIRPGDRCACCGAVLQPLHTGSMRSRPTVGRPGPKPFEAVMCPECGCEISEETGTDTEEDLRRLNPAA